MPARFNFASAISQIASPHLLAGAKPANCFSRMSSRTKTPTHRLRGRSLQVQHVLDALAPTDDPEMLGRLGGYEVTGVVGTGGMGVVLKALDQSLDRTVAIKVLAPHLVYYNPDDPSEAFMVKGNRGFVPYFLVGFGAIGRALAGVLAGVAGHLTAYGGCRRRYQCRVAGFPVAMWKQECLIEEMMSCVVALG